MNGILIACQIESIASRKDKTVKLVIGTQELSPSKAGELFNLNNKIATVYISEKTIDQREMDQVDKIDPEFEGKTQSQRIRAVLFILWTQDAEGFQLFDSYYRSKTDKYIEHLKNKIIP
jgi:hypothetical protein